MHYPRQHFQSLCIVLGLLAVLSSCNLAARDRTSSITPSSTPVPTEATQTCPASGKVRGVVIPAMPTENHPAIVYDIQSDHGTEVLRYDTTTARTTTILRSSSVVYPASVSPDGQWIILMARLQGQSALQLVQLDGQHLQTIYCEPSMDFGIGFSARLSPNQRFLAFQGSGSHNDLTPSIELLDLAAAKLHVLVSDKLPGYPHMTFVQQPAAYRQLLSSRASFPREQFPGSSHTHQFEPFSSLSGPIQFDFYPIKWASNSSLFLSATALCSPCIGMPLFLLRDIARDASQQQDNLQRIAPTPQDGLSFAASRDNPCERFDVTPNNQKIVCSAPTSLGTYLNTPAAIRIRPITGGSFHTIYRGTVGDIQIAAISNSTLLFIQRPVNKPETLWKINIDGSGLTLLMTASTLDSYLNMGSLGTSCFCSGSEYALKVSTPLGSDVESLVVGSLAGGMPKTIAQQKGDLELVGWSQ